MPMKKPGVKTVGAMELQIGLSGVLCGQHGECNVQVPTWEVQVQTQHAALIVASVACSLVTP